MTPHTATCPMTVQEIADRYFLEHRAKLLDLAAFLDRLDRASDAATPDGDHRIAALNKALQLLTDGQPERARRVQELLSDASRAPIDKAPGKGASGAPPR